MRSGHGVPHPAALMLQMQDITGLDNPNSDAQMKEWLSDNGVVMESLGKKEVAGFVKSSDGNANSNTNEALKLRLQLAKSSVKKYQAILFFQRKRDFPAESAHRIFLALHEQFPLHRILKQFTLDLTHILEHRIQIPIRL